jgi:hypothetical protein
MITKQDSVGSKITETWNGMQMSTLTIAALSFIFETNDLLCVCQVSHSFFGRFHLKNMRGADK